MSEQRYRPMGAYAKSKRANVVYALELARRLRAERAGGADGAEAAAMEAVVIHPGSARTNLQQHSVGLVRALGPLIERLLMGSEAGAAWPSLYAATSPDVPNGEFIGPAGRDQTSGTPKPVRLPAGADDPAAGARLWAESERLTGVTFNP
jgi:NAD(P)-dependent dehydrogenase (short-subunit alcohol dehydrogenase family)